MSKLDHTLFATWSKPTEGGQKTITNCIIGKPIIIVHKPLKVSDNPISCQIKAISGVANASGNEYHHYAIGTIGSQGIGNGGGPSSFCCIPTETTVVVTIYSGADDDCLYVYK